MKNPKPKLPGWKHNQAALQIRFDSERSKLEQMVEDLEDSDEDDTTVDLAHSLLLFYVAEHPYGAGPALLLSKRQH